MQEGYSSQTYARLEAILDAPTRDLSYGTSESFTESLKRFEPKLISAERNGDSGANLVDHLRKLVSKGIGIDYFRGATGPTAEAFAIADLIQHMGVNSVIDPTFLRVKASFTPLSRVLADGHTGVTARWQLPFLRAVVHRPVHPDLLREEGNCLFYKTATQIDKRRILEIAKYGQRTVPWDLVTGGGNGRDSAEIDFRRAYAFFVNGV